MPTGVRVRAVRRKLDEVDAVRDADCAREIREIDDARLQRRDEQRLAPVVVTRDFAPDLSHARLQLLAREVDLAQALAGAYEASSSRYRSAKRSMSRL